MLSIARVTYLVALRDRMLQSTAAFSAFVTALALALTPIASRDLIVDAMDLSLVCLVVISVFWAIYLGVALVGSEIRDRRVYLLITKPVSRAAFLFGKFAGVYLVVLTNLAAMAGVSLLALAAYGIGFDQRLAGYLWAVFLAAVEMSWVVAIAVMFSAFSTPVLSAVLTLLVYGSGVMSDSLLEFARKRAPESIRLLLRFAYYLLPNAKNMEVGAAAVLGLPEGYSFWVLLQAFCYLGAVLCLAQAIFARRNLP